MSVEQAAAIPECLRNYELPWQTYETIEDANQLEGRLRCEQMALLKTNNESVPIESMLACVQGAFEVALGGVN